MSAIARRAIAARSAARSATWIRRRNWSPSPPIWMPPSRSPGRTAAPDARHGRVPGRLHDAGDRARRDGDGGPSAAAGAGPWLSLSGDSPAGTAISPSSRSPSSCSLDAGGRIGARAVTLGGAAAIPLRMAEAEAILMDGDPGPASVRAARPRPRRAIEALEDAQVPAWYRRQIAEILMQRASSPPMPALPAREGSAP